jgi:sporulation protein YlmC with PRC-barrel domain
MNEQRSLERRTLERIKLFYYLRVYDRDSGEFVGSVYDLSIQGMKLVSERLFSVHSLYYLKILLPEGSILGEAISIDAQCRWRCDSNEKNTFEAGFEFVKKVDSGIYVIKKLIEDLQGHQLM